MMNTENAIVIASHPRSGTHLLIDLMRKNFPGCAAEKKVFSFKSGVYVGLDDVLSRNENVCKGIYARALAVQRPLFKTHRLPDYFEPFQFISSIDPTQSEWARRLQMDAKHIYVYRRPDKVMKSLYEFVAPEQRGRDIGEFIRQVRGKRHLSRVGFWAYHVQQWHKLNHAVLIDFDEIISHPLKIIEEISSRLALQPRPQQSPLPEMPKSLLERRIKTFFSRRPESSGVFSFPKNAPPSFSEEDENFIRNEILAVSPDLYRDGIVRF